MKDHDGHELKWDCNNMKHVWLLLRVSYPSYFKTTQATDEINPHTINYTTHQMTNPFQQQTTKSIYMSWITIFLPDPTYVHTQHNVPKPKLFVPIHPSVTPTRLQIFNFPSSPHSARISKVSTYGRIFLYFRFHEERERYSWHTHAHSSRITSIHTITQ